MLKGVSVDHNLSLSEARRLGVEELGKKDCLLTNEVTHSHGARGADLLMDRLAMSLLPHP